MYFSLPHFSHSVSTLIVNDDFSALNFQVGRGLWHSSRMLASFLQPRVCSHASTIQVGWCYDFLASL